MSIGISREWANVWELLNNAFLNVDAPYPDLEQQVLNHDYLAGMRFHTWDMSDEEYHFTLPWILRDLVTYHTPDPVDNQGGDEVLWSLQPWISETAMFSMKLRRLDLFDTNQGVAIIAWLEKARVLPGFSLSQKEIDSAIYHWRDHVVRHSSGVGP
jgi:hypothetical protein